MAECSEKQLLAEVPDASELERHRQFSVPTITYPYGRGLEKGHLWGLELQLRVDATGRVACYTMSNEWRDEVELNQQERRAILCCTLPPLPAMWNWCAIC